MKKETFIQKLIRLLKTIIFKKSEEKEKENSDLLKNEMYRKSSNVEFDVIYDDGSRHHVKEGILFEAKEDNHTVFHIGTSRKSVVIAFFEAAEEFFKHLKNEGR